MSKTTGLWTIFALGALAFVYWFDSSSALIPWLVPLFVVAILLHQREEKKNPGHGRRGLGLNEQAGGRLAVYDWLRLLAVVMVIVTHAVQVDIEAGLVAGATARYWLTVLYVLCLACNVLYVMLSGALLLPYKEENLSDFFLRRVAKVALPMVVYLAFYLWQHWQFTEITFSSLGLLLRQFFAGSSLMAPHYWLMYTILALYLVFPFLRCLLRYLSYRTLSVLAVLVLVYLGVERYLPLMAGGVGAGLGLNGWLAVAVWGYWVSRPESRRYDRLLMAAGAAAGLLMLVLIAVREDFVYLCCNQAPLMLLLAGGIFAGAYSLPERFLKPTEWLTLLSRYNFGMILIHWWVLHFWTRTYFQVYTVSFGYVGGILLSLLLTLLLSLAFAIGMNNLIVYVFDTGFRYVTGACRRCLKKRKNK